MSTSVDVVIAVHTITRPVARAVGSVLDGNGEHARVTVVCHDITARAIGAQMPAPHRDRVQFLEHQDGVRSAAGPFNAGMRAARGPWVSIMGSDDVLEPGAVASWLRVAERTGADSVVSRLRNGPGGPGVPTPPTRPLRRGLLDPVRDRLSYRSAPLGLVSVAARERLGAELVEGLEVGDDVPYVTRLWFETRVAHDLRGPAYLIGQHAGDRVTYAPRPVRAELAFVSHLLKQSWFAAYPERDRAAVVTKLIRIHLFGAVWYRPQASAWDAAEREALSKVAGELRAAAPRAGRPLSLADRALLDACLSPAVPASDLVRLAQERRRHGMPRTLLPRDVRYLLHREAPLRFMSASILARH